MFDVPPSTSISRRRLIGGSAAAAAAGLFGGALAGSSAAQAAGDGYGLRIVDRTRTAAGCSTTASPPTPSSGIRA